MQPKDRGHTFKISKEDGSMEPVAFGLRTPNGIGIGDSNLSKTRAGCKLLGQCQFEFLKPVEADCSITRATF